MMPTGIKSHTMRKLIFIIFILLIILSTGKTVFAHGYVFSQANEEMKENVRIEISPVSLLIRYDSVYLGQIAPHIRLMIDKNADGLLTAGEIELFFEEYKRTLNRELEDHYLQIGDEKIKLNFMAAFAPTLKSDSLLAPFQIEMIFTSNQYSLKNGRNEFIIDPKLLFAGSTHFLRLAKKRIEFTEQQEEAIGRYLQIGVYGDQEIELLSTYPGRLKNSDKMAYIYGVFYDKTPLKSDTVEYPQIQIEFNYQEQ
jgi:hypothetical protein